jgi:hypothetical protein
MCVDVCILILCSIVLVHGLCGHPRRTWTLDCISNPEPDDEDGRNYDNQEKLTIVRRLLQSLRLSEQPKSECFWPEDLLPQILPHARIMTWGYDVDINSITSSRSGASVFQHAENLLLDLASVRHSDFLKKTSHHIGRS